jgi:hypothetical protein
MKVSYALPIQMSGYRNALLGPTMQLTGSTSTTAGATIKAPTPAPNTMPAAVNASLLAPKYATSYSAEALACVFLGFFKYSPALPPTKAPNTAPHFATSLQTDATGCRRRWPSWPRFHASRARRLARRQPERTPDDNIPYGTVSCKKKHLDQPTLQRLCLPALVRRGRAGALRPCRCTEAVGYGNWPWLRPAAR